MTQVSKNRALYQEAWLKLFFAVMKAKGKIRRKSVAQMLAGISH